MFMQDGPMPVAQSVRRNYEVVWKKSEDSRPRLSPKTRQQRL